MKKQRRLLQFFLMIAFCVMVLAAPSVTAQAKVKLNRSSAGIAVNGTVQLKMKGTKKKVKWSSTNKNIVTVTSKGLVRGIRTGTAYIKAKVGRKTYKCKMFVVALNTNSLTLAPGSKATLGVYNGSGTKFYSNNYGVASVSSSGVVTATGYGTACITCVSRGVYTYCTVYVPQPTITSKYAKVGEQFLYGFTNCPAVSVSFATTNPSVVTVSGDGVCTAVGKGYAVVVANVGGCIYKCSVVVAGDDAIVTPESWILGSTREGKVTQVVKASSGTRSYSVYGQSYSANYVKNFATVAPNGVDTYGNLWLESTLADSTGLHYTARIYSSYMPNHGCAACSLATVLSAYTTFTGRPYDIVAKVERENLGENTWLNNYRYVANQNTSANQMPLSLYGMQQILKKYNVEGKYVRYYNNTYTAWSEIAEHLLKGKPVIIEVTNKNTLTGVSDTRWANTKHTMVLLGMTDTGKVIVADPADRSTTNFGYMGRIKLVDLSDVGSYMFSCTNTSSTNPYYSSEAACGGYILVEEK